MKYKSNFPVIVTMLICCVFIVIMNFVFTQSAVLQVEENILKNEYNKIGGKSNYQLLQSIQKKEVNILLNKLQTENPEYIYNLKQADSEADNLLPWDMMQEIDQKFPAESLSETKHILIEYSDLECAQCKSFRGSNILQQASTIYPGTQHIFQNFPLPSHKNALTQATYGKCIQSLAGEEKYSDYIDTIFAETKSGGEGFDLSMLPKILIDLQVSNQDMTECIENPESKKMALEEFALGTKIGIKVVPSVVVVNRENGEYHIISGKISIDDFVELLEAKDL